ncbi:sugar ABC transporter ATP-binding protein [Microbacterium hydrocarbonoxydans]|uniref:sugar ABC transporter ATP-binding protein n=1 Tax=Microbacterium hydrocarbonoxydans TaxID=273678 RepID=UPI003D982B73
MSACAGERRVNGTVPLLSLRGVEKSFGSNRVLRGVDVDVFPGEVVALGGENGSGKSTTARILAGVLAPDGGNVVMDQLPRRLPNPGEARALGIRYVGQEPALVPSMSIRDNLSLSSTGWLRAPDRSADISRALAEVEWLGDLHRRVSTLSAAEQAQLEIAKALLDRPRLLVLDEVTTRMPDPARLLDLIRRLANEGVAAILITHRFREIKSLADRAIVLRDGQIVGELSASAITDARLSEMMAGRRISALERTPSHRREKVILELDALKVSSTRPPVSLRVNAGEVVGIGGLMGSGRTSLLEPVAGARKPSQGHIAVEGTPLRPGIGAAHKAGIRLVPEDRNRQGLLTGQSIRANIRLNAYRAFQRPRTREDRSVAAEIIRTMRIKAIDSRAAVKTLSGGNAQKVVFGREAAHDPRIFLLDEPTRGVDAATRVDIYALIRERAGRGAAVLLVSSDMQELITLCDRVIVLFDGAVAGELSDSQITEEQLILLAAGSETATAAATPAVEQPTSTTERHRS